MTIDEIVKTAHPEIPTFSPAFEKITSQSDGHFMGWKWRCPGGGWVWLSYELGLDVMNAAELELWRATIAAVAEVAWLKRAEFLRHEWLDTDSEEACVAMLNADEYAPLWRAWGEKS